VADCFIPGRYTRYYVEPGHGRPIVSGRQLLQAKAVNLKYIAPRSFDYSKYELKKGMIAFGAEGRAEERIATPTLIQADRDGWLANNHVMRVVPKSDVHPGWLYLAFATAQVQIQVKALSCGSVVDAVYPDQLKNAIVPPFEETTADACERAWRALALAQVAEQRAIRRLEQEIEERT